MQREALDAERALGRLVENLEQPGNRRIWLADARRREVLASFDLDGQRVNWEDLVVAEIDRGLLPLDIRPSTDAPRRVLVALQALETGLVYPAEDGPYQPNTTEAVSADALDDPQDTDWDDSVFDADDEEDGRPDVVTAARQSAADIDAFLAAGGLGVATEAPATGDRLAPLSAEWLAATWRRAVGSGDSAPAFDVVAEEIAMGLKKPGLAGVAAALHRLHRSDFFPDTRIPDYRATGLPEKLVQGVTQVRLENQAAGPGWQFARLISPWIIAAACDLDGPGPWLSPALRCDRFGYSAMAGAESDRWEKWLCRQIAIGCNAERERVATLKGIVAGWEKALGTKRRWDTTKQALLLLVDQPAATSRWLHEHRGINRRVAQILIKDWIGAEIVEAGKAEPGKRRKTGTGKGTGARWVLACRLAV